MVAVGCMAGLVSCPGVGVRGCRGSRWRCVVGMGALGLFREGSEDAAWCCEVVGCQHHYVMGMEVLVLFLKKS